MSVQKRMEYADFTRTYFDLWGGTKIGMDTHALYRSIGRFYEYMNFDLLSSNICDVFRRGGEALEDLVMGIPFDSKFVVYSEPTRMAIFSAIDYNSNTNLNEVFIHSIFILEGGKNDKVFCEVGNACLVKVCADGSVVENPPELVFNDRMP